MGVIDTDEAVEVEKVAVDRITDEAHPSYAKTCLSQGKVD